MTFNRTATANRVIRVCIIKFNELIFIEHSQKLDAEKQTWTDVKQWLMISMQYEQPNTGCPIDLETLEFSDDT